MSKSPFVHLHTHSHYSLLDGLSKVDQLVDLAVKNEMPALAITDHGNMYGAIEFYKKCQKAGIKPIIGTEAYIANRSRFDKEPGVDNKRYHLTLLAKNETGYKNLMKLVSKSFLEGYYYKPRMDHDLLREHSEGIIALSGCFGGEFQGALRRGAREEAERIALMYQETFGKDNFFLEVMHHPGVEGLLPAKKETVEIAGQLKIPLVGTQDSHYPCEDDSQAHSTLLAIQTDSTMADKNRFAFDGDTFNFIDSNTAHKNFEDSPGAVEHTKDIADMVDIKLELGKWVFPNYQPESGKSPDEELRDMAYDGLKYRGIEESPEVKERIEYELGVIKDKGYPVYFLAVSDLLKEAQNRGILTNTRGSAAGSLVSYLTGITKVDPLRFNLPFERFLNPERPSAPDIDMDIADDRRDELIDYAREKYGEDHVAQIGTFGKMLARGVVRDVARALDKPYEIGDRIAKVIPFGAQGFPMTIDRALKESPDFKAMYEKDAEVREIVDLGRKLEGSARHVGVHAAGVVISPDDMTNYTPLQLDPKGGKIITQYDMYTIEDAGLLKFDFLGLRNLSTLADVRDRVKFLHDTDIDYDKLPLDDKETYEMLARGETEAVFQLNGAGMTRFLVELKPTRIDDILAMIALYRPGPMAFIPDFIERKRDPSKISYVDDRLEPILKSTYGILIFQDDILIIANKFAGYTMGEADKFRKAVGKKIPEEMAKQKDRFISGCIDVGKMKPEVAKKLWDMIETFAAYGFNKGHTASYGWISYLTAYMKAHYPAEYMAAVLTGESGDVEEVAKMIVECKRMGLEVLPPDVNESISRFSVVTDDDGKVLPRIRFGLRSIKNFGEEIGKAIIREREAGGPYKDFSDFLSRVQHKNMNKKSLEALILSGALANFGHRSQMMANLEDALAFNREIGKSGNGAQASLFGEIETEKVRPEFKMHAETEGEELTTGEKLRLEKDLLGLYISGHPLEEHKEKLKEHSMNIPKAKELSDRTPIVLAGLFDIKKEILTKKGDKMMFAKLEDFDDEIELVVFSDAYQEYKDILLPDTCVAIKGTVSHRNGEPSIIVERVKKL